MKRGLPCRGNCTTGQKKEIKFVTETKRIPSLWEKIPETSRGSPLHSSLPSIVGRHMERLMMADKHSPHFCHPGADDAGFPAS